MSVAYLLLAVMPVLLADAKTDSLQRVVTNLVEAAQRKDETAFERIAPNASFFVGDVGHPLTLNDVSTCRRYFVTSQPNQKVAVSEFTAGTFRELPAVKVRFDCGGTYELTFGVDGERVIGGHVSIFEKSPADG